MLLTTVDGLLDSRNEMKRIAQVANVNQDVYSLDTGDLNVNSRGGIASKIRAAEIVSRKSNKLVIANGKEQRLLSRLLENEDLGTLFDLVE